jgi:hypothetical protein
LDSIEEEYSRMRALFVAKHVKNISFSSNNNRTQSSVQGGEAEVETKHQFPMEIEVGV